jgi:hypothetical protein
LGATSLKISKNLYFSQINWLLASKLEYKHSKLDIPKFSKESRLQNVINNFD